MMPAPTGHVPSLSTKDYLRLVENKDELAKVVEQIEGLIAEAHDATAQFHLTRITVEDQKKAQAAREDAEAEAAKIIAAAEKEAENIVSEGMAELREEQKALAKGTQALSHDKAAFEQEATRRRTKLNEAEADAKKKAENLERQDALLKEEIAKVSAERTKYVDAIAALRGAGLKIE